MVAAPFLNMYVRVFIYKRFFPLTQSYNYSSHSLKSLMADLSPLLLPHKKLALSLDDIIELCIGKSFGRTHLIQAILVSFAWFFDAQQTFISVFTDRQPSWHCTNKTCSLAASPCQFSRQAWAWDAAKESSVVSEWDLACAGPFLAGLPSSSFYLGCLLGGLLLATLADSTLGRKNMLLLSCLAMSLAGALTVFSPNIWVYSLLRFVSGFGRASIGTCSLVLSTEVVGKRWRGEVGIMGFFAFTLGFLSLPLLAYLTHESSWRSLYLFTSLPALIYCLLIYLFVHESPRWLLIRGRTVEAVETLEKLSPAMDRSSLEGFNLEGSVYTQSTESINIYSAMKVLWEKKWAFRRLAAIMVVSFGVGLIYYGMPLAAENLRFDHKLSVTFDALAEFPSSLVTIFIIGKLNRRSALLFFTLASGAASGLCAATTVGKERGAMRNWVQMGAEVGSFFSACTAFNVLMIYTLELFPTCVRNSALSLARQAVVFGGVFGPLLVAAGRNHEVGGLSFTVFGLVIGICGLFVVCLPETQGKAFCDTMEVQEEGGVNEENDKA